MKRKLMYSENRLVAVWDGEGTRDGRKGIQRGRKELWVVMDMLIILMVRLYTYMSKLIKVYTVCAICSMSVVYQ